MRNYRIRFGPQDRRRLRPEPAFLAHGLGLILLALAQPATVAKPQAQARATVRILQGAASNKTAWNEAKRERRRQIQRLDDKGKPIVIRVVEYE